LVTSDLAWTGTNSVSDKQIRKLRTRSGVLPVPDAIDFFVALIDDPVFIEIAGRFGSLTPTALLNPSVIAAKVSAYQFVNALLVTLATSIVETTSCCPAGTSQTAWHGIRNLPTLSCHEVEISG
jgi:hypothetical protein